MKGIEQLPIVSHRACRALGVETADVVESIERLIRDAARGKAWNAPKSVLSAADGRYMMATLCASDDPPLMAVKSLMVSPVNHRRGLDSINAAVVLHDGDTGLPLAVVDGNWVTVVRTAGLSAVAARYLARPDARVAAFIGCGVQADGHLDAFRDLFPLAEVRAAGRGRENRDRFLARAESMGLAAVAHERPEAALDGADLVVTSLPLSYRGAPFLDAAQVAHGAFCAVTDLAIPWKRESMSAFDRVIIDDLEQERKMDRPLVAQTLIDGDLAGLVTGLTRGRSHPGQRCAFVFRGLALGDLAVAALAWRRYRDRRRGSS